ncbi:hypothetical protein ACP26L_34805 [Paenibacillus sp. S-38]|uniref:hypothetical protein n=1 Tax=Paenibacillus sp. S-38 TaxID=3416710 RepID=UPI003CF2B3E0
MSRYDYDSSLQSQNPVSQAQNSEAKAHNAVTQAQSHPSAQLIEQAHAAVDKAHRSLGQVPDGVNPQALELTSSLLAEDEEALNSLTPMQEE